MENCRSEMRVIGLTGGIASGKSTVAKIITDYGIPVIDADQLSRDAVLPGTATLSRIVEIFGSSVLHDNGSLDRKALAETIFSDSAARRTLESILHPAIKKLAQERLEALRCGGKPVAFYMAPLLIEAGAVDRVDEVWVVYIDRETQLERIVKRDAISREDAEKRLAAQMPMNEKTAFGRVVIDNSGDLQELRNRVEEVLRAEKLVN
jgi:dephospho-CoA kinase